MLDELKERHRSDIWNLHMNSWFEEGIWVYFQYISCGIYKLFSSKWILQVFDKIQMENTVAYFPDADVKHDWHK